MANNLKAQIPDNVVAVRQLVVRAAIDGWPTERVQKKLAARKIRMSKQRLAQIVTEAYRMGLTDGDPNKPVFNTHLAWLCGVTPRRARLFFSEGRVPGVQHGRSYAVSLQAALEFAEQGRVNGYPRGKSRKKVDITECK